MKALVTGGGGFLGRRVVELLLEQGHGVRFLARGRYPEVEKLGAEAIQADLRDEAGLDDACRGVDLVFHVAAKPGYFGAREEYRSINVDGTRNIVQAARHAGCKALIYTSTPSVVGYAGDVENGGQDLPYAERHESIYPETKAEAERFVLQSNGAEFATVALRPHLIIGPGDNHLLPRIVTRAASGKLPIVGDGSNRVDLTYIDNAAWAHLDAAAALSERPGSCAGKAYFISNGEPVVLWEWLNGLLKELGLSPVKKRVSLKAARALGAVLQGAWTLLPLPGEPRLTPFLAAALARSHWYDMEPARRDLGYRVRVPMAEATRQTALWLRQKLSAGEREEAVV